MTVYWIIDYAKDYTKRDYAALWTYFLLLGLFCLIYTKYKNIAFSGWVWSFKIGIFCTSVSEAYLEPSQISEMELFADSH